MNGINNDNNPGFEDVDDFSGVKTDKNKYSDIPEAEVYEAEEPTHDVKQTQKPVAFKIITAVVSVIAFAFIAFTVYGATVPQDKILKGIHIGDLNIGGMKKDEAVELLSQKSGPYIDNEVVINANNKRFVVLTDEIDASIDAAATVEKAFEAGKGSNVFANAVDSVKFLFTGKNFLPVISYNEEKFADKINEIGTEAVGSQLVEHSVRFDEEGKAYIVPGKSGYNNNPAPVMEMVKKALLEADTNEIEIKFEKTKPVVLTIEALDAFMYKAPVNASFTLENGDVKVVQSEQGRFIDKEQCKNLLSQVTEGGGEIEVPYNVSEPELKAEDLRGKLFNAELASYSTRYAAGGNRGSNVNNAAAKINGKILLPGETFSFNETVGRRTVANGFKPAPEYQNGQTVTGIGGGTCQVSTTVYSAVLYADLKIVKRSNHSMSVSYVPLGQDATVTDGGIDFKFMNDTEYPVKIKTATGGGKLTVTIIGTAPAVPKTVKISHKSTGSGIRTTRIVYDANGNVLKEEDMGLSKYKPHAETENSAPAEETPAEETPVETEPVTVIPPVIEPEVPQPPVENVQTPVVTQTPQQPVENAPASNPEPVQPVEPETVPVKPDVPEAPAPAAPAPEAAAPAVVEIPMKSE